MKSIVYASLIILVFSCKQIPEVPAEEKLRLYNNVLDQIVMDNYFQHCLIPNERIEQIQNDFYQGKIDSLTYSRIGDSLNAVRKSTLPKCVLNLTNDFQIYTKSHELNGIKFSIAEALKDTFLINNFNGVSINTIVDTLSRPSLLDAGDLAVNHLEIIPHLKKEKRPFGEGMGVMGLSRIYFNSGMDRAILYYEFNCGPKCGTGEVLFITKTVTGWRVKDYKRVWDN